MLLSLPPDKTPLCPHRWDVAVSQGSTWSRTLVFGDPIGADVRFRGSIARRPGAPILARFRSEVLDDHQIVVSLTAAETAVLPAGALAYDLEAFIPGAAEDNWVQRVAEGRVTVTGRVVAPCD